MSPKWLVASVLLLLLFLSSEVLSSSIRKRDAEEKTVLAQIQDAAQGYVNYVSTVTNTLVEKVKSLDVSQRIWNGYNSFIQTVGTYKNIITDQVVHFWQD